MSSKGEMLTETETTGKAPEVEESHPIIPTGHEVSERICPLTARRPSTEGAVIQDIPAATAVQASIPGAYANYPGGTSHRLCVAALSSASILEGTTAALSQTEVQDSGIHSPDALEQRDTNQEGLAHARLVTDEANPSAIAIAYNNTPTKRFSIRCKCLALGLVMLVVILGVTYSLWLRGSNASKDVKFPKNGKTNETLSTRDHIQSFPPWETLLSLQDSNSPQSKALEWLQQDPQALLYSQERIKQRFALAAFYYSTNGPTWTANKNWLQYDQHECYWELRPDYTGLFTNDLEESNPCEAEFYYNSTNSTMNEGRFQRLWMMDNNLEGTVPLEISWLTDLQSLSLFVNWNVSGTIPTELARLTNVKHINWAVNQLSGSIPTELGLMTQLTFLSLRGTGLEKGKKLSGSIPTELGLLTELKRLGISLADITGFLPTELFLLTNMLSFDNRETLVAGSIPSEIGLWTSLVYILLDHSRYSGTVPSEIGNLKRINWFDLSGNALSGSIPTEVGVMEDLQELSLAYNSFGSSLPTELNQLQRVQRISIFNNQLVGRLPDLDSLSTLTSLKLAQNAFSGPIPSSYGLLAALESLDLANNLLGSSIPSELGNLSTLTEVFFQDNFFNGTLPLELSHLDSLIEWNSANNLLSGEIPPEYVQLPSIRTFNVSGNGIASSSGIPVGLCKGNQSLLLVFDCNGYCCGCTTDPSADLIELNTGAIDTDEQGIWNEEESQP